MDKSKIGIILQAFKQGKILDDEKAHQLCRTHRFSAIIYELRHRYNLDIADRWVTNENTGTRYKEYWLVQ